MPCFRVGRICTAGPAGLRPAPRGSPGALALGWASGPPGTISVPVCPHGWGRGGEQALPSTSCPAPLTRRSWPRPSAAGLRASTRCPACGRAPSDLPRRFKWRQRRYLLPGSSSGVHTFSLTLAQAPSLKSLGAQQHCFSAARSPRPLFSPSQRAPPPWVSVGGGGDPSRDAAGRCHTGAVSGTPARPRPAWLAVPCLSRGTSGRALCACRSPRPAQHRPHHPRSCPMSAARPPGEACPRPRPCLC